MKEKELVNKALDNLNKWGISWVAVKRPFFKEQDIFGAFDIIHLSREGVVSFIQITSKQHKADRVNKIMERFARAFVPVPPNSSVWCYDQKTNGFIIVPLRGVFPTQITNKNEKKAR